MLSSPDSVTLREEKNQYRRKTMINDETGSTA